MKNIVDFTNGDIKYLINVSQQTGVNLNIPTVVALDIPKTIYREFLDIKRQKKENIENTAVQLRNLFNSLKEQKCISESRDGGDSWNDGEDFSTDSEGDTDEIDFESEIKFKDEYYYLEGKVKAEYREDETGSGWGLDEYSITKIFDNDGEEVVDPEKIVEIKKFADDSFTVLHDAEDALSKKKS